jgi:hypothetical protein
VADFIDGGGELPVDDSVVAEVTDCLPLDAIHKLRVRVWAAEGLLPPGTLQTEHLLTHSMIRQGTGSFERGVYLSQQRDSHSIIPGPSSLTPISASRKRQGCPAQLRP